MPAANKVEKYRLEGRILALSGQGLTTHEVAEAVTRDLNEKAINDKISAASIARFLRTVREERSAQTRELVREHIKATVPADLDALQEIESYFLTEFRNDDRDLRTRGDCGMKVVRIIETKLKFAGLLDDPEAGKSSLDPVDLDEFRTEVGDMLRGSDG